MANIITAGNSTNGGTAISTDTSGTLNIVTGSGSGATAITVDGSQNLSFNSGYGSAAVAYGCRAWVNFNGVGTVTIRASGNVTSITDNGVGDYTVNFTTAMPDTNFAPVAMILDLGTYAAPYNNVRTTTTCQVGIRSAVGAQSDTGVAVSIFR